MTGDWASALADGGRTSAWYVAAMTGYALGGKTRRRRVMVGFALACSGSVRRGLKGRATGLWAADGDASPARLASRGVLMGSVSTPEGAAGGARRGFSARHRAVGHSFEHERRSFAWGLAVEVRIERADMNLCQCFAELASSARILPHIFDNWAEIGTPCTCFAVDRSLVLVLE